ncbi:MAG: hypothetical protein ACLUKN_14505 [Bacilli bacterium]
MQKKGAFFTMSESMGFPTPPEGKITINKDNFSCGISHIWWKGREHYRHRPIFPSVRQKL